MPPARRATPRRSCRAASTPGRTAKAHAARGEVCEAIKLYLDVPGIVFVLGCDQNALWRAVHESAGIGDPSAAVEYLEKIVQISYRIPVPSMEQAVRLVDGYLTRSRTSGLFDASTKNVIIGRSGRNPRRIKRLFNSFVLEYHLNRSWDEMGVANLMKVIMLQHFYPGFYRLLASPRDDNPINEFLSYRGLRTTLKQDMAADTQPWAALFESKGLRPSNALSELEDELPAEYPTLAADREFVVLLESIDVPSERLVEQLQRRPLTVEPLVEWVADEPAAPDRLMRGRRAPRITLRPDEPLRPELGGLQVVWVDDLPPETGLVAYLRSCGVRLSQVTDRAEATAVFGGIGPDAVLSDLRRGTDDDAGITDLAYFREYGVYTGPILFFSGRSPDLVLQDQIRALDADGPTNNEEDVVRWLERVASAKKG